MGFMIKTSIYIPDKTLMLKVSEYLENLFNCKSSNQFTDNCVYIDVNNKNWSYKIKSDKKYYSILDDAAIDCSDYVDSQSDRLKLFIELINFSDDTDKNQWFKFSDGSINRCLFNTRSEMWGHGLGYTFRKITPLEFAQVFHKLKSKITNNNFI